MRCRKEDFVSKISRKTATSAMSCTTCWARGALEVITACVCVCVCMCGGCKMYIELAPIFLHQLPHTSRFSEPYQYWVSMPMISAFLGSIELSTLSSVEAHRYLLPQLLLKPEPTTRNGLCTNTHLLAKNCLGVEHGLVCSWDAPLIV